MFDTSSKERHREQLKDQSDVLSCWSTPCPFVLMIGFSVRITLRLDGWNPYGLPFDRVTTHFGEKLKTIHRRNNYLI